MACRRGCITEAFIQIIPEFCSLAVVLSPISDFLTFFSCSFVFEIEQLDAYCGIYFSRHQHRYRGELVKQILLYNLHFLVELIQGRLFLPPSSFLLSPFSPLPPCQFPSGQSESTCQSNTIWRSSWRSEKGMTSGRGEAGILICLSQEVWDG